MATKVSAHVDSIESGIGALLAACEDPTLVDFDGLKDAFERLEKIVAQKSMLDALFAYVCDRDGAGREVGSPYASEYLRERLGISAAEAYSRISRGRDLYAPPPSSEPDDSDNPAEDPGFDFSAGNQDAEDDVAERQRRARNHAKQLSDEKMKIIDRALKDLLACAQCERAEKATPIPPATNFGTANARNQWARRATHPCFPHRSSQPDHARVTPATLPPAPTAQCRAGC